MTSTGLDSLEFIIVINGLKFLSYWDPGKR